MSEEITVYCTFCNKANHEVKQVIAGPSVYICDECVWLCDDILRESDIKSPIDQEMQSQIDALSAELSQYKAHVEELKSCIGEVIGNSFSITSLPDWWFSDAEKLLNQFPATSLAQVEAEAENNKWIDRNMLTPQLDMHVLVCGDDDISTSFFRRIDEGYEDFEVVGFDITHWREMPEPYANNLEEKG